MASPRTRKPPEGGSAIGPSKEPAGSVQDKPVAEASPERVADPTPPSVKEALEVVARHGELTEDNLDTLTPEELQAVSGCVKEFNSRLAMAILRADEAGDVGAVRDGWTSALGWLNMLFNLACTWKLQDLPAEEAETVRKQPVNAATWKNLRRRARWHGRGRPRAEGRDIPSRLGRGQHVRHARRRGVRSGPRKARAPGSRGDDDPDDLIRLAAASVRLWAHVRRREARLRLAT
jgi:hypothetical protein